MKPETVLLQHQVWTATLPEVTPGPGIVMPRLKRLNLPQGELAQFHDGEEGIRYIAFIELRQGTVRGNHYHKVKQEYVYLIRGEMRLALEDLQRGDKAEVRLRGGDLAFIGTGIAHALEPLTDGQAIEYSAAAFDPGDIYRHALL